MSRLTVCVPFASLLTRFFSYLSISGYEKGELQHSIAHEVFIFCVIWLNSFFSFSLCSTNWRTSTVCGVAFSTFDRNVPPTPQAAVWVPLGASIDLLITFSKYYLGRTNIGVSSYQWWVILLINFQTDNYVALPCDDGRIKWRAQLGR